MLHPISVPDFFAGYWEQQHWFNPRNDPGYFENLLTLDKFDEIVTMGGWPSPPLEVIGGGRVLPRSDYAKAGAAVDMNALVRQVYDGASLRFVALDRRYAPMRDLCNGLTNETSIRFQANIYFTPGEQKGFNPHYDTHDVFILQLHGEKLWTIYEGGPRLPTSEEHFRPNEHHPGRKIDSFVLKAGDTAYVPRGVYHDARSPGASPSLHATLGCYPYTWEMVMHEVLREARDRIPLLRQALPREVKIGSAETPARLQAGFAEICRKLHDDELLISALDFLADHAVRSGPESYRGMVANVEQVQGEDLAVSILRRRPAVVFALSEEGEELVIDFKDRRIRFPSKAAAAIRRALDGQVFIAGELPGGLDTAGNTTAVQRLLIEGLLEFVPSAV